MQRGGGGTGGFNCCGAVPATIGDDDGAAAARHFGVASGGRGRVSGLAVRRRGGRPEPGFRAGGSAAREPLCDDDDDDGGGGSKSKTNGNRCMIDKEEFIRQADLLFLSPLFFAAAVVFGFPS